MGRKNFAAPWEVHGRPMAALWTLHGRVPARPVQHGQFRPSPAPARGLGFVYGTRGAHGVRPHDEVEDVGEAVRRVDPPPAAGLQPYTGARLPRR